MKNILSNVATVAFMTAGLVTGASASTIDFTTSTYASTFGPNVVTDTVDGVNFTIVATARGANGFRQGGGGGLKFGVPGNGMYTISIVADQNLTFNSMYGAGHTLTQYAGQLPFDLSVDGSLAGDDLMFTNSSLQTVSFGGINVDAGEAFLFAVDFGSLTGSSIYASALVKSFDFSINGMAPVPLPASLPLLLGGLGLIGFVRRRRS
ncbi:VPLPA-CTERM sorting domain-containing protein [Marimonas arenosa]|uniref:VPLPA-CTERM sorting domain-containing protein n=1 Tax=Marimonas arenosa TaxID=1795305 RepID=A0AAE3WCY2_9RHOB|nr:VPLPA-CTERM sorting domain-containing protein [Marimonas arenosa]MDQ2090931.1 VPLPA-CTERM sorting domain-containing protein [Marimonas arenosa]